MLTVVAFLANDPFKKAVICGDSFLNSNLPAPRTTSDAFWTNCLMTRSPDHPAPSLRSFPIDPSSYFRNIEMSWTTMTASISWKMKSRCSALGIWQKPYRIGTSGLLVISTRSRTFSNRASAKSCRIIRIWSSLSHSSRASTISK